MTTAVLTAAHSAAPMVFQWELRWAARRADWKAAMLAVKSVVPKAVRTVLRRAAHLAQRGVDQLAYSSDQPMAGPKAS